VDPILVPEQYRGFIGTNNIDRQKIFKQNIDEIRDDCGTESECDDNLEMNK